MPKQHNAGAKASSHDHQCGAGERDKVEKWSGYGLSGLSRKVAICRACSSFLTKRLGSPAPTEAFDRANSLLCLR